MWRMDNNLRHLLYEIVSWDSRTGTIGEIEFPHKLKNKLLSMNYFQGRENQLKLIDAGEDRHSLAALYQSDKSNQTVVLMSHFDTVHTEEYGAFGELAFQPKELKQAFKRSIHMFSEHIQADILSDEYIFGRGTMDMKMGLVLHLHLLDLAIKGKWPINILLLTVPDEEVNSAGMRTAVKGLVDIRDEFNLSYQLFLNSEPSFTQTLDDDNYYIYSGTIGKIMPAALFYGKSTHAGEPLNGLSSYYMAGFLNEEMELSPEFNDESYGETTPLPVILKTFDLKEDYSVQTSHHVASLYNVFMMERTAENIMGVYKSIAERSMKNCQKAYDLICEREGIEPIGTIDVLTYEELYTYAVNKLGKEEALAIKRGVENDDRLDVREKSVHICDQLLLKCPELAPATIVFFAPPYYPAINSTENELADRTIKLAQKLFKENYNIMAKQVHYFNGISDLSYLNYDQHDSGWKTYQQNTPVWGSVYSIPFEEMQQLNAPILNIGPFGKDPHRMTERLHVKSAFEHTPYVLRQVIKHLFEQN